jgi:hypothetical protein
MASSLTRFYLMKAANSGPAKQSETEILPSARIIGADGVAGGDSEIGRKRVEGEPADLASLARFTVFGAAFGDTSEIGGGNPMLAFLREEMVGDAKKAFDGDSDANLFEGFTDGTIVKSFEVFEFAADDAPQAGFGRPFAESEESATAIVEDEDTHADSGERDRSEEILRNGHVRWSRGAGRGGRPGKVI